MKNRPLSPLFIAGIFLAFIASFFLFAGPATPVYASSIGKTGLKHMQGGLPKADKPALPDSSGSTQVAGSNFSGLTDSSNAGALTNNMVEQFTSSNWITSEVTASIETPPMFQIELTGTVEVIAAGSWTIDGMIYLVDDQTKIEDMIQVGDQVEFYAYTTPNSSMVLAKVELYSDYDQYDDESENEYKDQPSEDRDMYSGEDDDYHDSHGSSGTYQSSDDDYEEHQNGSYYDDNHEDNHNPNNGSGSHHDNENDDDHKGHDD